MRFLLALIALIAAALGGAALAAKKPAPIVPAPRPAPPLLGDKENLWYLDLSTGGRVVIQLRPDAAPKTVERIKLLTRQHFYDGLTFHRVIEGFMAQSGDPKGDGTGGSTLPNLAAEFNWLPHVRGAVSFAREGAPEGADAAARKKAEDSANSQFFIVLQPKLSLDRKYTVFGRVIAGMEFVDTIVRGEPPANPSRISHAWIASDNPPPYTPPPPGPPSPALSAPTTPAPGTADAPPPVATPAAKKAKPAKK